MVGRAVSEFCRTRGDIVLACDHRRLDIANRDDVLKMLHEEKPDAIINCAAWTDVDGCERDRDRAFDAHAHGPENLAIASKEINSVFVTISTDYVFDGTKKGFYTETDQPNPLSVYGMSKLEGERLALKANPATIIVRSGFIFGSGGSNFLSTILDRARRGEKIKAISDSYGTPTYSRDLAARLREFAKLNHPGVFHVANAGDGVSYAQFAREAMQLAGCSDVSVEEIQTDSLKRPAPRPINSRLLSVNSEAVGLSALPDWRNSLNDFVRESNREGLKVKTVDCRSD
jgi:dTDP-4-dehydrorhamnose reductase